MVELGKATRKAIEASGKKVVVLASNSLSHRHFTTESEMPEDMSKEHITSHAMHLWDMRIIEYMRTGQSQRILDEMPEFTEQAIAESDGGGISWLLSTLDTPDYPGHSSRLRYHHRDRKRRREWLATSMMVTAA